MVNHGRTLLANLSVGNLTDFAEEFIEPGFLPVALPACVVTARRILYGSNPDRGMINYRCRQLLSIVHATPLVDILHKLDGRVSYSTGKDTTLVDATPFQPVVTTLAGGRTLSIIGSPEPPDYSGVMHHVLEVTVLYDSTVEMHRLSPPASKTLLSFTIQDGLSEPLPLTGTGYSCRLTAATGYWSVEVRNRPQRDPGQLLAEFDHLADPTILDLFGVGGPQSPTVADLYEVWRKEQETPLRLAALILAIILRTERERTRGQA